MDTHTGDRDVELKNLGPAPISARSPCLSGKEATANVDVSSSDHAAELAVERETDPRIGQERRTGA